MKNKGWAGYYRRSQFLPSHKSTNVEENKGLRERAKINNGFECTGKMASLRDSKRILVKNELRPL